MALTRAKWALDADELQTMKDRAKFFGLDKADNFREFEEKYLKAEKVLRNHGGDAIIKARNADLPNGLPIRGQPNTVVDKTDDSGATLQRRMYDEQGMAKVDFDTSDHGAPLMHPTGAHKHVFDFSRKNPRGKPLKLTLEDLIQHWDIIKRGENYHDEDGIDSEN